MATAATPLFLLFLLLLSLLPDSTIGLSQSEVLLQLKKSFQHTAALSSWATGTDPCSQTSPWQGVVCFNGIVIGLHLGDFGLSGTIDVEALGQLPGLHSLSLYGNAFSGQFPSIGHIRGLKSLFLQNNRFSGPIPADAFAETVSLKKLWLAGNSFSGMIPDSLTALPHLIELRLEHNAFSGNLPAFVQPSIKYFNVSNNQLEGNVSAELTSRFGDSSFNGNPNLCIVGSGCEKKDDQTTPLEMAGAEEEDDAIPPAQTAQQQHSSGPKVVMTMMVVLLCVALCMATKKKDDHMPLRSDSTKSVTMRDMSPLPSFQKKKLPLPTMTISATDLVFVQEKRGGFALVDLMRAAAEVLGSDELGSSYKAVIGSAGRTVVVKRMKEMNQEGKEGFHAKMRHLGTISHPNLLPPVAYHYRRDEKLLVFDHATMGNLLFLLHGDRGPHRPILEWQTRVQIAKGIARGMAHLHSELSDMDLPHGNLKSTNILFSDECEPLIADFGFSNLINPALSKQNMVAFRSPEFVESQQVCHKSDVWCLGLVILEIVTSKFPSQYLNHGKGGIDLPRWVRSEIAEGHENDIYDPEVVQESKTVPDEMRQLLQIGLACTEPSLEKRLDTVATLKKIEIIKVDEEGGRNTATPSLMGGLSASARNTSAVFSSRWSGPENLASLSNRHGDTTNFPNS